MSRRGRVYFKKFRSVMGKFPHTTIIIPASKGILTPENAVLRREPSWVNIAKYTALRQSVDVI